MEIVFYFDKTGQHHKAEILAVNPDDTVNLTWKDKHRKSHTKSNVVPKEKAEITKEYRTHPVTQKKIPSNFVINCYKIVERPE